MPKEVIELMEGMFIDNLLLNFDPKSHIFPSLDPRELQIVKSEEMGRTYYKTIFETFSMEKGFYCWFSKHHDTVQPTSPILMVE